MQCDPIEKKPFFHAHPGALAYSFGMLGCDLHCGYCQNWVTSQALRDPNAVSPPLEASPEALVRDALDQGAKVLVSTYNEPLITSEWAVAVFKEARAAGLLTGFVSNGNGTPQVLEYLRPWLDLYKVDLKSFDDRHYHELGGRIGPILDSIRRIHADGIVARDRHAAHPRLQRLRRRTAPPHRIPRRRFARHSLARHRLSRRLQNARRRPARHHASKTCCAPPKSAARPACATSTPEIFPAWSATGKTRAVRNAARL